MKCKLCEVNNLDNTGAHYITESIARSAVSEDNTAGRDNEIMYSLSIATLGKNFIGRKINEEKIREIKGQEMTDKELAENENMMIDYELVCRACENKFNPIETYFISYILRKQIEVNTEGIETELNKFDYKVTLLFVIINIWRTSASIKTHFKIKGEYEEELRILIDKISDKSIDKIIESLDFENGILNKIRLASYYLNQDNGKKSENQISITSDSNPITLILNQIVFLVFFDLNEKFKRTALIADFTSKNKMIELTKSQPNSLKIRYVSDLNRKRTLSRIVNHQIKELTNQINYIIKTVHLELYGFEAHKDIYKATKSAIGKIPDGELNIYTINRIIAEYLLLSGEYYKRYGIPNK